MAALEPFARAFGEDFSAARLLVVFVDFAFGLWDFVVMSGYSLGESEVEAEFFNLSRK